MCVCILDCRALCHSECKEQLPLPCVPTVHTPKKKQKVSHFWSLSLSLSLSLSCLHYFIFCSLFLLSSSSLFRRILICQFSVLTPSLVFLLLSFTASRRSNHAVWIKLASTGYQGKTHTHTHTKQLQLYISLLKTLFLSPPLFLSNERAIKELKERLLTARGTPNFDKVEDVNVICGCLKQFLLQLQEPLVTNKLRMSFINAIGKQIIITQILFYYDLLLQIMKIWHWPVYWSL